MQKKPLGIARFPKLVIEALEAARVEYLIGGAIAEWAWGEPRATQDPDLVVEIPVKAINKLSKEGEAVTFSTACVLVRRYSLDPAAKKGDEIEIAGEKEVV